MSAYENVWAQGKNIKFQKVLLKSAFLNLDSRLQNLTFCRDSGKGVKEFAHANKESVYYSNLCVRPAVQFMCKSTMRTCLFAQNKAYLTTP